MILDFEFSCNKEQYIMLHFILLITYLTYSLGLRLVLLLGCPAIGLSVVVQLLDRLVFTGISSNSSLTLTSLLSSGVAFRLPGITTLSSSSSESDNWTGEIVEPMSLRLSLGFDGGQIGQVVFPGVSLLKSTSRNTWT